MKDNTTLHGVIWCLLYEKKMQRFEALLMITVGSSGSGGETTDVLVNTLPWQRVEVVTVGGTPTLVSVPSMGTAPPDAQTPSNQATLCMWLCPVRINFKSTILYF